MEIKTKVAAVLTAHKELSNLKDVAMAGKLSYQIKRLKEKLTPIVKSYEETRTSLIKEKYGVSTVVDGNEAFEVPKEKLNDFLTEINNLIEHEESIEINAKLKISDFDNVSVSPAFFEAMDLFIEE